MTDQTTAPVGVVSSTEFGKPCVLCDDGDGHCVFPYYGIAPHIHDTTGRETANDPWAILGSTRLLPRDQWGPNFREDPESKGQGVYLRCPSCGCGELPNTKLKDGHEN
jgi:hypothetical protein